MALETNRIDSLSPSSHLFRFEPLHLLVKKIAPYATVLREFVNAAESKELIIVTSDLTLSEVLVKPNPAKPEPKIFVYYSAVIPLISGNPVTSTSLLLRYHPWRWIPASMPG